MLIQEIFDCFSFKMFLENENAGFADIINFWGRLFKADRYPYDGVKTSPRLSVCRLHNANTPFFLFHRICIIFTLNFLRIVHKRRP